MPISKLAGSKVWHTRKLLISTLITIQTSIIVCQVFPYTSLQYEINYRTGRFVHFFGFEQSYAVFTNPPKINKYLIGVITYKSGLTELYNYPRMEQFNILERTRFERYRKFFSDNLDSESLKDGRQDFARYVARTHFRADDPPYAVSLNVISRSIPPPHSDEGNGAVKVTPFINYLVQPTDFN